MQVGKSNIKNSNTFCAKSTIGFGLIEENAILVLLCFEQFDELIWLLAMLSSILPLQIKNNN